MHFNQQKRTREKYKEKNITTYYSRELEGRAALEHSYPVMLSEKL